MQVEFGYSPVLETQKNQLGFGGSSIARVVAEFKGAYRVRDMAGEYLAKVTGRRMFDASSRADYPAVGDFVTIDDVGNGHAVIRDIMPRRSMIKRKFGDKDKSGEKNNVQIIAANVDVAFVVESVGRDYNLNRFERYFALAEDGNVSPAIILNKIDLVSREASDEKIAELKQRFPGIDVLATSTVSSDGLASLQHYIAKGKTYCFLGSSGVGKSSLINTLLGEHAIKVGEISSYSDRGKHVTTGRQMYFLENGGIVIDNPGTREVGLLDADRGIGTFFDVISGLAAQCKYADCTHTSEPGCAVLRAVESGEVLEEQYANYLTLKKEAAFHEMSSREKREKDRRFGKLLHKMKKGFHHLDL